MPVSIAFAGTPEFAVPSLQALAAHKDISVEMVITQPDKPVGRKQALTAPPVKVAAEKLQLPVFQPENINTFVRGYKGEAPDFLVVIAYGQLLKTETLHWPKIAPLNAHASLLPQWRGASPIHHALLSGDQETGVTIQRMVEKLDAGPILHQKSIGISNRETLPKLHDTLANISAELLVHTVLSPLVETEQQGEVTRCKKLTRDHGKVDPSSMTAQQIDRTVRALVPWPGAWMERGGKRIKIHTTNLVPSEESCELDCKDGTTLYLEEVQEEGRNKVTGKEWNNKKGAH